MPFTIEGAKVLTNAGIVDAPLHVDTGVIVDRPTGGRRLDMRGLWCVPGIVDLHGDAFERHLAPRRGAVVNPSQGLPGLEAELAASGITTAVLAQFFSWEGGMRGPDFADRLVEALAGYDAQLDLRLQMRLEVSMIDDFARAEALIARAGIGYVVFNDHLPHAALRAGKRPPRLTGQALKAGRSPQAHLAMLQGLAARDPWDALETFTARLHSNGVLTGSHDDTDPATRARYRALGVTLAEFPETVQAAQAAKDAGDTVIMGAPNVVRGGSHAGKVTASELVRAGLCDALVSDYHYPTLAAAALKLTREGHLPFAQAWAMISTNPARILGLSDRGKLGPGQRADVLLLDPESGQVAASFAQGRLVHATGRAAAVLLG